MEKDYEDQTRIFDNDFGFFAISLAVRWIYAWVAYIDDAKEHNQPIELNNYFNMTKRYNGKRAI
ncbi:MAG TPA: hypothetical protein VE619_07790 [Nitrososphaeraceae archaeon]|nr:hypothetical protein [Nitrososphaeraceae archaeon]